MSKKRPKPKHSKQGRNIQGGSTWKIQKTTKDDFYYNSRHNPIRSEFLLDGELYRAIGGLDQRSKEPNRYVIAFKEDLSTKANWSIIAMDQGDCFFKITEGSVYSIALTYGFGAPHLFEEDKYELDKYSDKHEMCRFLDFRAPTLDLRRHSGTVGYNTLEMDNVSDVGKYMLACIITQIPKEHSSLCSKIEDVKATIEELNELSDTDARYRYIIY